MTEISTSLKTAKLIMVTSHNNNKYYEMKENENGTFTVRYGRVGGSSTTRTYPLAQWDKKYNEKVRKGYKDQTHLFVETDDELSFSDVEEVAVQQLINELMRYANKSISHNYNVSAEQVTRRQVEEAQQLLDRLVAQTKSGMDLKHFNQILLNLYQVIPRRMSRVGDHLIQQANTPEEIANIENKLSEEQATLDVMRGQVAVNEKKKESFEEKKEAVTLLEAMGLEIKEETDEEVIQKIKKLMQTEADKFVRAYQVNNLRTQQAFEQWLTQSSDKKVALFWHGSRNENWMSILETGLVLRPANAVITGKMFGYGLYFADKFKKSLNYTSLRGSYWTGGNDHKGFLALYDVHVGKQLKIKKHQNWCYELNEENLKKKGKKYNSLFAQGGADLINNEYIIYNQAQCTVKYLVEVG